ncbi:MAG TPA: sulfurtransferase [Anaerolineae bacterium]|nr:sulfurtransferase [Anaerolineae bacterium]
MSDKTMQRISRREFLRLSALVTAGAFAAACVPTTPMVRPTEEKLVAPTEEAQFANPQLLVETDWLAEHLKDENLRIVDARKAEDYARGHIPGAISIPRPATFDPDAPKGILGKPEQIAELFGGKGINEKVHVVVYDGGRETAASRVFWTLEYYGHPNVSVLNGGFTKWRAEGRGTSTEEPEVTPVRFTPEIHPEVLTTKEEILSKIGQEGVVFLDARSLEEYKGRDVRAKRGGHIPGAVNLDWRENFTEDDVPVFKSPAQLKELYTKAGVTPDKEVHAY